jgi:hypothetical protein
MLNTLPFNQRIRKVRLEGDRGFESISLQRGVSCELEFSGALGCGLQKSAHSLLRFAVMFAGLRHCEHFGCTILRAIGLLVFIRLVTFHTASVEPGHSARRGRDTAAGSEYLPASPREPRGVGNPGTLYVARPERKDRAALPGKADQSLPLRSRGYWWA